MPKRDFDTVTILDIILDDNTARNILNLAPSLLFTSDLKRIGPDHEIGIFRSNDIVPHLCLAIKECFPEISDIISLNEG